ILDVNQPHDATCLPSPRSDNDGHAECPAPTLPGQPTGECPLAPGGRARAFPGRASLSTPPPPHTHMPQAKADPTMTATAQTPSKAQAVHISAPSAAASTPVPSASIDPQAQLESDKRAVYR
ncbi:Homeobox protein PKNOX2, partial [Galemys pyrenaicus]